MKSVAAIHQEDEQLLRQKRLDVLTQADTPLTGTFPADV